MKNIYKISIIAVVLLATVGLSASFLHNRPTYMSDTVTYVAGAESLAAGDGYMRDDAPITTWPPGYSLMLALPISLGLDSFVVFKIVNIICATIALLALFLTIWRVRSYAPAVFITACVGCFFPWIYYTHTVLSDIPFATALAGFVLFGVLYEQTGGRKWLWCASLMCAIAPLIRTAGIALIPALALLPFLRHLSVSPEQKSPFRAVRAFRGLFLTLLPPLLLLSLWLLRNHHQTGSLLGYSVGVTPEYALSLNKIGIDDYNLFTRIWVNLRGYLHIFVVPDQVGIARISKLPMPVHLVCAAMWAVIFLGWVRSLLISGGRTIALTVMLYGGVLILNTWYDIRYLLPVVGFCFYFMCEGFMAVVEVINHGLPGRRGNKIWHRVLEWGVYGFFVLFATANLTFSLKSSKAAALRSPVYEGALQHLYVACEYIARSDEAGDVLVAGGPGFVPLWTGRKVHSLLSMVGSDRSLKSLAVPDNVRFVIGDESKFSNYRQMYLEPFVKANREGLREVFRDGETVVWRRSSAVGRKK